MPRAVLIAAWLGGMLGWLFMSPAASPDATFPFVALALVGFAGLVAVEHRNPRFPMRAVLVLVAAVLAVAVVRPPHGSRDVWSYVMYGRMVSVHHASPYVHRPAEYPGDPALAQVAPGWRHYRSLYGPGFTGLSAAITSLAGRHLVAARMAFQAIGALAVLAAALMVLRVGAPSAGVLAFVANPLVIVWVVNGGHNDPLVALALLGAAVLLARRRPVAAGLALAGGALVKVVALPAVVPLAAWQWRRHGAREAARFATAAAAPVAAGYAIAGGMAALRPVLSAGRQQSRATLWQVVRVLSPAGGRTFLAQHINVLSLAAVTLVAAALAVRRPTPARAALAVSAAYLVAAAYVLPWYFVWALPLVALEWPSRLGKLLVAQSGLVLLAYEYRVTAHPDALDRLLHATVTGTQVFALAAAVAVVAASGAVAARRGRLPARSQ